MPKMATNDISVGLVANPASGRDVRRLVARASVFPISEKCSMITRLLTTLGATGVGRVVMMPDHAGLADSVRRAIATHCSPDPWPQVVFLDMPVEGGPIDTLRAVTHFVSAGVGAIIVIGGDGTQRLAATACGDTPVTALSAGTNNIFPEVHEPTIAGLATGLVANGRVSKRAATTRHKVLRVEIDGTSGGLALVDICVASEGWIGSKALWRPETLNQIFVAFAGASAIGLSSVAGLLCPVSRRDSYGLRVDLAPLEDAPVIVNAPIAPGLMARVGVAGVCKIRCDEQQSLRLSRGVIALDGEREIEFGPGEQIRVRLEDCGPYTIDVERVMAKAAEDGLLLASAQAGAGKEVALYAAQ
jgi:predicted polyphosphate/ATP-dependent NAD kinase